MSVAERRLVPNQALDLIARFEGLHDGDLRTAALEPQPDPVGVFTVGYGYALFERGRPVTDRAAAFRIWRSRWPRGLSEAGARALLRDTAQAVGDKVLALLPGVTLADPEFSALVSLAYNIGVGEAGHGSGFAGSTVRRRLLAGDRRGAADALLRWRFAAGRELPGLERRRRAERELFLSSLETFKET